MFIMSDKETAAVVQGIYDSFMAGDIAAVIGSLSDNVEWVLPEIPKVPFSGKRQGKDSLTAFFSINSWIGPRSINKTKNRP